MCSNVCVASAATIKAYFLCFSVGVEYLQPSLERTGSRVRLWPATGFTLVQLLIYLEGFGRYLFLNFLLF